MDERGGREENGADEQRLGGVFNENGATVVRLGSRNGFPNGALIMYHNQERTVNMPVSQITGNRGRAQFRIPALPQATHMIADTRN